jgi:hypothetical protein
VAWTWFEALYDVVKAEQTTPPPGSRIYGITAVALSESIVAGTKENRSLVGQVNGLTSVPQPEKNRRYHWPTVANAALADTIRGLYPMISQCTGVQSRTDKRWPEQFSTGLRPTGSPPSTIVRTSRHR